MATAPPQPKKLDLIRVQTVGAPLDAVVCTVFADDPTLLEVVFLDDGNRATNTHVIWTEDGWSFRPNDGPDGTADKYDRLREAVRVLRTHLNQPAPQPPRRPRPPSSRAPRARDLRRRR